MKFGLGYLTPQRAPSDSRTDFTRYQQTIEKVQLAERVGFDAAWLAEHHGSPSFFSSLPTMMMAIAENTHRLEIGTGSALAPFYDPIRLAEDVATVDTLSGGRVMLGLALGYRDVEFERYFQIPKSERVGRLKDCVAVCRRGWTGEPFSYEGEVFQYEDVRIVPTPYRGRNIPILVGAFAEPAVRRAARIGDGFIKDQMSPLESLDQHLGWIREENPPDDYTLVLYREGFLAESASAAWETVHPGLQVVYGEYREASERSSDDFVFPDVSEARDWGLYGSPGEVADSILEIRRAYPVDHLVIRLDYPTIPHADVLRCIERFGQDVIPRVRAAI